MPIIDFLERNASLYGDDIALVEVNPEQSEPGKITWKDYSLIQPTSNQYYRREISWSVFNEKANRMANMLLERGIQKGNKVGILMMNCLEWLPIYFGILKTGAIAVPLNFRYSADEILYCADLAELDILVFGPEFIGRIESVEEKLSKNRVLIYVGSSCPTFAEDYNELVSFTSSRDPKIYISDDDFAAIYFSSGTTGFPKAILHRHRALVHSCKVEQNHHGQNRDDCFLCIPPLYHTGAKMHWFGSLISASTAVILKGTKAEYVFDTVSREHCTIVWLLVPWAQDILDALDSGKLKMEDYKLSQWRL
ncbi:MAG: acyl--CoA ligase, partial [Firmicutes bacterium]|nr:acyl--CoA ligase [Bacillota bacterium]